MGEKSGGAKREDCETVLGGVGFPALFPRLPFRIPSFPLITHLNLISFSITSLIFVFFHFFTFFFGLFSLN